MGPRASRRKVVSGDSDDEESEVQPGETRNASSEPQKHSSGRLKSIKNGQSTVSHSKQTTSPQHSPRKSKSNLKNATKAPPKPAEKPIYSFFNAAIQRQAALPPSASSQKLASACDDVEAIHDGTDNEEDYEEPSSLAMSKGSSTALAMRKRKFQRTQSFENELALPPAASQKFRKASSGDRLPSFSVLNVDKRPWNEQFAPSDLSELAVHKRKVADVRSWIETTFRGKRQRVLILKGAAGTGKTTTVHLIAKDLGIELLEWRDPAVSDNASNGFVATASRFEEFVSRAGKSRGLTLSTNIADDLSQCEANSTSEGPKPSGLQALLLEEFPNTFSRTSSTLQSFRSTIAQYVSSPVVGAYIPTPIIMIISETLLSTNTAAADSFTAHRLLGLELITNPYVNVIEFNPIAPTFLTKALETIVVKEARKSGRRKTPGPQVLKLLAETGDIRSAVSSLEFLCLRGDDGDTWSSKVAFTKAKQTKAQPQLTRLEEEALKLITNRESSLGIFHSVGKVVYNKRTDPASSSSLAHPPVWLPQHRRERVPEADVDSLIDELGTDTATFIAALHENYALSCSCSSQEGSLDSLLGCMDNLSDADLLSVDQFSFGTRAFSGSATDTLRQDDMSFQVAVRGTLFSLPCPVHRSAATGGKRGDAHRMFYPTSLRLWRKQEEIEGKLSLLINTLGSSGHSGASVSGAAGAKSSAGVESWGSSRSFKGNGVATDGLEADILPHTSSELKSEMLLDRLPYLSNILAVPGALKVANALLEQIRSVTRIEGAVPPSDDEDDQADGENVGLIGEQWATDQPYLEHGVKSTSPKKTIISSKRKSAFETIAIPVESQVERLVLEDDDIVDD